MEVKNAQVSDNGRRIVVDLKRKRAFQNAGAAPSVVERQSTFKSPFNKLYKRERSNGGWKENCGSHSTKSLIKKYSNFMKSGLPQRLMFYHNGEWTNFPEGVVELVKKDFQEKKAAIEVEVKGRRLLLHFIDMIQVDLNTGLQQPIAWIDEAGGCFFPISFSNDEEVYNSFQPELGVGQDLNGTSEIRLQLEIEIVGDGKKESSEESYTHAKRLKIEEKPVNDHNELEEYDSNKAKLAAKIKGENFPSQNPGFDSIELAYDTVKHMLLMGMGSTIGAKDILEIYHTSSNSLQVRWELFQKQIEITKKYRGDANIRYAWLGSSRDAVSRIMKHGLGLNELPKTKLRFGDGVHLTSAHCSYIGASYSDVDENGVRYMVLCRVIMGKMELVHAGSEQYHPSSEDFDSGVDDLQNPCHYIVWNMNINTHIYPEYVIGFKVPPIPDGYWFRNEGKLDISRVSNSTCGQQKPGSCFLEMIKKCHPFPDSEERPQGSPPAIDLSAPRTPKSPWMPFPMLFAAISDEVPPRDMEIINLHYDKFKSKMISRDDFIKKLRWIVGDTVLKSAIMSVQSKLASVHRSEPETPKQEKETTNRP